MACAILLNEVGLHAVFQEALACARRHADKQACLVAQKDEFLRLIINSIRNDLISRNEAFQCLALGFVGNGARWSCMWRAEGVGES
jgi:hypothetical protein